ncbi:P-loop containing nucleoside triphosphate hydrolase protein [Stachybotrys elegans]|uniref:P-loop containing nucleoside triphosphate hydrolase protein n=1 Tax=Stachybotrys elegans TaxID=80388 RepID=A0A8K0SG41_9HYPO|nr:P-loop containing nucleoside triphosphate hydrolase protein [Stachybotrys elegans]
MIDEKGIEAVLAILLPQILEHGKRSTKPFILGLSGLQGSGKSTWAIALATTLTNRHSIKTRILSLDDLYHDHPELVAIRSANPSNALLQTRGQPGTHDEALAKDFFSSVLQIRDKPSDAFVEWPAFDKSLHSGQGGRVPRERWVKVPAGEGLDVLIFEGWCLGFTPLTDREIKQKWEKDRLAIQGSEKGFGRRNIADHELHHLQLINSNLNGYYHDFMGPQHFDGLLHLSTNKLLQVYEWRLDQERALRKHKPGMTDDQVIRFVRGYMPAYELYLNRLQQGNFFQGEEQKKHVQVILNHAREVLEVKEMD